MTSRATRVLASTAIGAITIAIMGPFMAAPAAQAETVYTLQDVQKHGTAADCWSIVGTGVYDLTTWIPRHEGGPTVITGMCGIDGTSTYMGAHGPGKKDPDDAARALARLRIGAYDTTSANFAETTTYVMSDVAKHSTATDCWTVVGGKVYNLTNWVTTHPGGRAPITAMCGIDGTAMYTGKHGTSTSAAAALKSLQVGVLSGGSATATTSTATYSMKQVRRHRTATSCWTVIGKSVYDVTTWIARHPGGKAPIMAMCGKNGTASFRAAHSTSAAAKGTLRGLRIGKLR